MRKQVQKERCTKIMLTKCKAVCCLYDKVQLAAAKMLDAEPAIFQIECNVPILCNDIPANDLNLVSMILVQRSFWTCFRIFDAPYCKFGASVHRRKRKITCVLLRQTSVPHFPKIELKRAKFGKSGILVCLLENLEFLLASWIYRCDGIKT